MERTDGFYNIQRTEPAYVNELQRINNWDEFIIPLSDNKREEQASRCMDCGTPFCHNGCPLNNLIPEWNSHLFNQQWEIALERLLKTNNFPEFTGRVCPALCEGSCTLGLISPSVSIKNNELSIIEKGFDSGYIKPYKPKERTGKKVAVIGSGPSGLACADMLNRAGHSITVYEKSDKPGGILMYGIPNMKLDKSIVKRRIDIMKEEGVAFICQNHAGKDITCDEIEEMYDAAVLCIGSSVPRDLKAEGRNGSNIHFAMDYLTSSTKNLLESGLSEHQPITAKDKDVIVIGGGDTGNDCVATAIRQGCKSITQLEIMPKFPETRSIDNPWPQHPNICKTDYGQRESIALFGKDPREYCISTKAFVLDNSNNLTGVSTVKVEWKSDNKKSIPVEIPDTERLYPAQLAILAMGFIGPDPDIFNDFRISRVFNGYRTDNSKIFVAGDMRRGQSLVVWAIKEGRQAAMECDRYLMGSSVYP